MKKWTASQICFVAVAAALNMAGGSAALLLRLPIYLDSLGTVLTAALFGPVWGMIPGAISGFLSGCISDPFAFYYIPVQMLLGFVSGVLFRHLEWKKRMRGGRLFLFSALLSIPGTLVSSAITAYLFGGVTSSGSTILVQLLHGLGLDLTASVFAVQAVTDYADRTVVLFAAVLLYNALPAALKRPEALMHKGGSNGTL